MKRFTLLLLALAILSFAACGGDNPPDSSSTQEPPRETRTLRSYDGFGLAEVNEKYIDSTFYSSNEDMVTYTANALWDTFGLGAENKVGQLGGGSAWLYWDAVKASWYNGSIRNNLKNVLRSYPQRADGYLWSWGDSETWGGAGYNNNDPTYTAVYHFDQMFNFVNAVKEVCVWEASPAFLYETDGDTAVTHSVVNGIEYDYEDSSRGRTVLEKVECAVNYSLEVLGGKNGLIVIDNGFNDGEFGSASSNYWDNLCFGYKDAYEGALFLGSLDSLVEIYTLAGNAEKAAETATLLQKARAEYDKTFWDAERGRYIATVSKSGKKMDYGFTFLNTEALYYGAGDSEKAQAVFSWIDGDRTVAGDELTGREILDKWKIAPVTNTIPVESQKQLNDAGSRYLTWWHAPSGINVFTNSKFGLHCENGGAIFYTAYFELMSRIKYGMTEQALQRWITIADEYAVDKLWRDPYNTYGSAWILGVIGEFPESGTVPVSYLRGFVGVNAHADGLHIKPSIPKEYNDMGAKNIYYKGSVLDVKVATDGITVTVTEAESKEMTFVFADSGKTPVAEVIGADGSKSSVSPVKVNGGYAVTVNLAAGAKLSVK